MDRRPVVLTSGTTGELVDTDTLKVAALKVTGGSPATGKVLTSDSAGVATWQTPDATQAELDAKAAMLGPLTAALDTAQYYRPITGGTTSLRQLVANEICGALAEIGKTTSITSLAINVTTAGSTGSVIRLGVYSYNRANRSCVLVADFGTVTTTTTGTKTATSTAAVTAGQTYLFVAVGQGSPTTQPTVTSCASHDPSLTNGGTAAGIITINICGVLDYGASPSGALPGSFITPAGASQPVPLVAFAA